MIYLYLLVAALSLNLFVFIAAFIAKTDKLTDITYTVTFILLASVACRYGGNAIYRLVILDLILLWSIRLGAFLFYRIQKNGRDRRFDGVRENLWKFGRFWLGQGLAAWLIALPALFALVGKGSDLTTLSYVGVVLAAIGLSFETLADYQKLIFAANSKNKQKFIKDGLWNYSRHPNYFGEIVFWLGIYVASFSYLNDWQKGVGLIGPLTIAGLLLFLTGVPKLEKAADKKWGGQSDYQRYKKTTSLLIPLPKKGYN